MVKRRRKILLGYNCTEDGSLIGNTFDGSLECIVLDIDSLRHQKILFGNLVNVERNHSTNFIIEQDGSLSFIPRAVNPDKLPRFCNGRFTVGNGDRTWTSAVLLGLIETKDNKFMGYRVYNCEDKKAYDLKLYGINGEYQKDEVYNRLKHISFSNAEWIYNGITGSFWNQECYPVFRV